MRPLLTHHVAGRWRASQQPTKLVLYPYEMTGSDRTLVDQSKFPKAFRYLERHRERLESRKYLVNSGRSWFEIWVPHQPSVWAGAKLVWPDISEKPRFFLDESGAIVNGDCYWIKLKEEVDPDWLKLMLAVANSSLATELYDKLFHNKLYAKRRRFMTQYVKQFPLPKIESPNARATLELVDSLCGNKNAKIQTERALEMQIRKTFGVGEL